jgi:imidazolonepropionase-like amidohydrolase
MLRLRKSCAAAGLFLVLASPETALAERAQPAESPLVAVRAARVLDVRNGMWVGNAVILIEKDRIHAVGPAANVVIPGEATLVDWSALSVLPGWIDTHVHVAWGEAAPGLPMAGTAEALRSGKSCRVDWPI